MINIKYQSDDEDLLTRLLKVRGFDTPQAQLDFLSPNFKNARHSPWGLSDMDKAVVRIIHAIQNKEKIMIFWDYDADGVTSTYVLFDFFRTFIKFDTISVQLPHRLEDGYGIKSYHLDQIKEKGVDLVITVDNGITAIEESLHAQEIGLDLIITDHHQPLEQHPTAVAVVNPQISPDYSFHELCGVGVVFKLINALAERLDFSTDLKKQVLYRYLPIVAIGTVADCVPLIGENRLFVKKGLEIINTKHPHMPASLRSFLEHFNLHKRPLTTTDIWYMIWPRLNAAGRMLSAYEAFYALRYTGEKQKIYLEKLGKLNLERKGMQDEMIKKGIEQLDLDKKILILCDEEYHEGIVWIVAGRLTEKYYKPSMVLKIDSEKGIGVASLRGPAYFSVIDMLYRVAPLLDRFGGHKQAGGLTVKVENLQELVSQMEAYCEEIVTEEMLRRITHVDTILHEVDLLESNFRLIDALAPFGEGNREPALLIQNAVIKHKQIIWKTGKSHLKLYAQCGTRSIEIIQRNKGENIDNFALNETYDLVVSHRWDDQERWYLVSE
jgi:single-stranded-DNA-specific exonuclease